MNPPPNDGGYLVPPSRKHPAHEPRFKGARRDQSLGWSLPESHKRIFICPPAHTNKAECARTIIASFARRAFRRPVPDEVFSVLMGDDVELRKHFIQTNAKDVRFLDI